MTTVKSNLKKIYRFHYSPQAAIIPLTLAFIISLLVAVFTYNTQLFALYLPLEQIGLQGTLSLPLFLLTGGVIGIRPVVKWLDTAYEISEHHVRAVWGRVSLKRRQEEIPFETIRGVRVEQHLIERFLNCGSIVIWTSFVEHPDIIMKGVAKPSFYAKILHDRIDNMQVERKNGMNHSVHIPHFKAVKS